MLVTFLNPSFCACVSKRDKKSVSVVKPHVNQFHSHSISAFSTKGSYMTAEEEEFYAKYLQEQKQLKKEKRLESVRRARFDPLSKTPDQNIQTSEVASSDEAPQTSSQARAASSAQLSSRTRQLPSNLRKKANPDSLAGTSNVNVSPARAASTTRDYDQDSLVGAKPRNLDSFLKNVVNNEKYYAEILPEDDEDDLEEQQESTKSTSSRAVRKTSRRLGVNAKSGRLPKKSTKQPTGMKSLEDRLRAELLDEDDEGEEETIDVETIEAFESFEKYATELEKREEQRKRRNQRLSSAADSKQSNALQNMQSNKQHIRADADELDSALDNIEQLVNFFELVQTKKIRPLMPEGEGHKEEENVLESEQTDEVDWDALERSLLGADWTGEFQGLLDVADKELPSTSSSKGADKGSILAPGASNVDDGESEEEEEAWKDEVTTLLLGLVLSSHKRYLQQSIFPETVTEDDRAQKFWDAPFALLVQDDSKEVALEYANKAALSLLQCEFLDIYDLSSYGLIIDDVTAQEEWMWKCQEAAEKEEQYTIIPRVSMIGTGGQKFIAKDVLIFRVDSLEGNGVAQAIMFKEWEIVA